MVRFRVGDRVRALGGPETDLFLRRGLVLGTVRYASVAGNVGIHFDGHEYTELSSGGETYHWAPREELAHVDSPPTDLREVIAWLDSE